MGKSVGGRKGGGTDVKKLEFIKEEEEDEGSSTSYPRNARKNTSHSYSSLEMHSIGIGTPAYMAPEQKRGTGKYNCLADMYSLGLIFFEMWAGFQTVIEMDKAF